MPKLLFKKMALLLFVTLSSGCSIETNVTGVFLLENNFKIVGEYENEEQCTDENKWFLPTSAFTTHSDETYELKLLYKNGEKKEFCGEYKIYVGNKGHSGEGFFVLDDNKIDLAFQESYFLIFTLPIDYNPSDYETTRTLYFQRW